MQRISESLVLAAALAIPLCLPAFGAGLPLSKRDAELPKLTMPDEFALVFSFGYVHDHMPKDPKTFEFLLKNMKRAGINTLHCKYNDWRLKLCEKYGVRMLIDLSVPEHDLKQAPLCKPDEVDGTADQTKSADKYAKLWANLGKVNGEIRALGGKLRAAKDAKDKAALAEQMAALQAQKKRLDKERSLQIGANVKAICAKVRGSKGVWGYGLWYDNGTSGAFLNHAVEKLRVWDPTHVTYVGSYRHRGLETVTINPGCYGWYDFHWTRGTHWHYLDMMVLHDICGRRNAIVGRYIGYAGLKQDLYTMNQSIAAGLKMTLFFIGGPFGREDHKWYENQDLVKIAAEFRHMYKEIMLIGHPTAYYSTLITKTHHNKPITKKGPDGKPVPNPIIPRWFKPFPKDHWAQAPSGEAMVSFFKYKDGTDAIYVANHNAFAPQDMAIKFNIEGAFTVKMFNRKKGGWIELPVKDNAVSFKLGAGSGELLKIEK